MPPTEQTALIENGNFIHTETWFACRADLQLNRSHFCRLCYLGQFRIAILSFPILDCTCVKHVYFVNFIKFIHSTPKLFYSLSHNPRIAGRFIIISIHKSHLVAVYCDNVPRLELNLTFHDSEYGYGNILSLRRNSK